MQFVTKLGELTLLLPLALLLAGALWRYEARETAQAFIAPLFGCLLVMLVLKLFFLSCGDNFTSSISSPSGHAAASTFVFGSIGLVMSTHAPRWGRIPIAIAVTLLIVAIAVSRVYLGAHSIPEVLLALVVGTCAVWFFALPYNRMPHPNINFWGLTISIVMLMVVMYGIEAPTELFIRKWAGIIRVESSTCSSGKHTVSAKLKSTPLE